MQGNILKRRSKLILWVFPLYFPQVANEHNVHVINIIISYVAGEQLITPMKALPCVARATSLSSSRQNFCVCYQYNSDSVLLFIMCGHCC